MKHKAETHAGRMLEIVKNLRGRRETDLFFAKDWYEVGGRTLVGGKLFTWIDLNTEGCFYFSIESLRFENEKDAVMFKLGYHES